MPVNICPAQRTQLGPAHPLLLLTTVTLLLPTLILSSMPLLLLLFSLIVVLRKNAFGKLTSRAYDEIAGSPCSSRSRRELQVRNWC